MRGNIKDMVASEEGPGGRAGGRRHGDYLGVMRMDRKGDIKGSAHVGCFSDKARLRWFRHELRRDVKAGTARQETKRFRHGMKEVMKAEAWVRWRQETQYGNHRKGREVKKIHDLLNIKFTSNPTSP